ncbi:MAG TPA: hypothetical protein VM032_18700 [Vicinamibacterales bacterium]|nr:hypothetical protein [Vicinamibacterales bacterium]
MPPERRRLYVLVALLVVALIAAAIRFWPSTAGPAAARAAARANRRAASRPAGVTAPDVHLQALGEERPRPVSEPRRDLFRFKPKPAPPRVSPPVTASAAAPSTPSGPPPAPGLAPIAMRFIGLVEAPEHAQKIAILSDGRGIYQGREGDIIEGRYRILKIGVESIDMAYIDGRGRQTIRLSGS